ncbi:TPA: hypothetical protein DCG86_04845 [Candidatus Marinimicrobia bacterium]|nr:MAG: hypothetical protein XD77_0683 [Marinimicrobia bacterium 46_47]KUK93071.1 MAG: hypothetical protein XE04_0372 [Marinimicrobia bacterium 46_43]HAE87334.1 hypothetical protein [Candidatus Neomarinimicrobiota bacterium]
MAHAYTPGLKVLAKTMLTKTRRLPLKGNVKVKKGDLVKADDIVAHTDLPGNVFPVNVANFLNVDPSELDDFMIRKEGDVIRKGDILAETKGIFGLFKSSVKSPVAGTLDSYSKVTGQAIIRENPIPVNIHAYIDGVIDEVIPEEGVVIRTTAAFVQGIFGIGGERRGAIKILTDKPGDTLTADLIDDSCKGKVLVGGAFMTLDAFKKAEKIGVEGIIVGGFNYKDIKDIVGYDIGVAITGEEPVQTTLIVTEGFGEIPMAEQTFNLLKDHEEEVASINGATQIRAGVIRPEVIICLDEIADNKIKSADVKGMDIGTVVRVIRAPYFGLLGEVTELPHALQKLESGSMARVAKVKIYKQNKEVMLPRANLEIYETK